MEFSVPPNYRVKFKTVKKTLKNEIKTLKSTVHTIQSQFEEMKAKQDQKISRMENKLKTLRSKLKLGNQKIKSMESQLTVLQCSNTSTTETIPEGSETPNGQQSIEGYEDKVPRKVRTNYAKLAASEKSREQLLTNLRQISTSSIQRQHPPAQLFSCAGIEVTEVNGSNNGIQVEQNLQEDEHDDDKVDYQYAEQYDQSKILESENYYDENDDAENSDMDLIEGLRQEEESQTSTAEDEPTPIMQCNICEKVYTKKPAYLHHMGTHSSAKDYSESFRIVGGSYKCPKCGRIIKNKGNFNRHMPNCTFKCEMCQKVFRTRWVLNKHVSTHTKPHLCPKCPATFGDSSILKRHLDWHKRKKSFKWQKRENSDKLVTKKPSKCPLCDVSFYLDTALALHVKSHRSKSQPESYECPVCPKVFPKISQVENHLKVHSKNSKNQD